MEEANQWTETNSVGKLKKASRTSDISTHLTDVSFQHRCYIGADQCFYLPSHHQLPSLFFRMRVCTSISTFTCFLSPTRCSSLMTQILLSEPWCIHHSIQVEERERLYIDEKYINSSGMVIPFKTSKQKCSWIISFFMNYSCLSNPFNVDLLLQLQRLTMGKKSPRKYHFSSTMIRKSINFAERRKWEFKKSLRISFLQVPNKTNLGHLQTYCALFHSLSKSIKLLFSMPVRVTASLVLEN